MDRYGGDFSISRHLVVFLQRHNQHGVRFFAELDQVGHAADHAAIGGLAEGGLVDRAVGAHEPVIRMIEFAACVFAVGLWPAFVTPLSAMFMPPFTILVT